MNFKLDRFIHAQDRCYGTVLNELKSGDKRTHWMWFIFPQLKGLGRSSTANYYGISDLEEAGAYLDNALLRQRLIECTEAVLAVENRTLFEIFGNPDQFKFCSCMTLFETAGPDITSFRDCLDKYCDGKRDRKKLHLLNQARDR